MSKQNDVEWLIDQLQLGNITADKANVEMVRMERVRVITTSLSANIRKALNEAVKSGYLCRMKKEGRKPEVYYHPNFKHKANQARNDYEFQMVKAISATLAHENGLKG